MSENNAARATAASDIYSNAFNFASFISSGVDERTGSFNFSIDVIECRANRLRGPDVKLTLSHDAFNQVDVGFGPGWSLTGTRYDVATKRLMLGSGENYTAITGGQDGEITLSDLKVKALRFFKKGTEYQVIHKDGTVEIISIRTGVAVPRVTKVISPDGHTVEFAYDVKSGLQFLSRITDDSGVLLQLTYATLGVTAAAFVGTKDARAFRISKGTGLLTVRFASTEQALLSEEAIIWSIGFKTVGLIRVITEVRHPTGLVENVTYQDRGHQLPPGAPITHVPYVIQHIRRPYADQPAIQTTYAYSSNNYLGYASGRSWVPNSDNAYLTNTSYVYKTTVTEADKSTTVTTFNRFHLTTQIVYENKSAGLKRTQDIEYPMLANAQFKDQPANFQMPQRVTTTWEDGEDRYVSSELGDYDDYGNLLKSTEASGIVKEYEYYPAAGSGTACPADPNGFVNWTKSVTTIPASALSADTWPRYEFSYVGLTRPDKTKVVALASTTEANGNVITYDVDGSASSKTFALVTKATVTYKGHSASLDYTYALEGDDISETEVTTTWDGARRTRIRTFSPCTGVATGETDGQGVQTTAAHDFMGRILSEKIVNGSQPVGRDFTYALPAANSGLGPVITVHDASGTQQRVTFDGLNRPIEYATAESNTSSAKFYRRVSGAYSDTGRIDSETTYDHIDAPTKGVREIMSRKGYQYDGWGEVQKIVYDDGYTEISHSDPVKRQVTEGVKDGGKVVKTLNVFDQIESIKRIAADGTVISKTTFLYDGLGRPVSVDSDGVRTGVEYDELGRVASNNLPDGSVKRFTYDDHLRDLPPIELSINNQRLGSRVYDGLGRMTGRRVDGVETAYTYEGGSAFPRQVTTAAGNVLKCDGLAPA